MSTWNSLPQATVASGRSHSSAQPGKFLSSGMSLQNDYHYGKSDKCVCGERCIYIIYKYTCVYTCMYVLSPYAHLLTPTKVKNIVLNPVLSYSAQLSLLLGKPHRFKM